MEQVDVTYSIAIRLGLSIFVSYPGSKGTPVLDALHVERISFLYPQPTRDSVFLTRTLG